MTDEDDTFLVAETLRGNSRAFETLVERHHQVLFHVAFRMVGNSEDAKDIIQTMFLKAYEKLATFNPHHKFFSWIYRITVNESINLVNRRKPCEPLNESSLVTSSTPESEYESKALADTVNSALMKLSVKDREALILRSFVGLSYDQIGSLLKIPARTVKSRLFGARRRLCEILLTQTPSPR